MASILLETSRDGGWIATDRDSGMIAKRPSFVEAVIDLLHARLKMAEITVENSRHKAERLLKKMKENYDQLDEEARDMMVQLQIAIGIKS